jgi:hypothetical protein
MQCVLEQLEAEHAVVPYCVVEFSHPSFDVLHGVPQRKLEAELVAVGRALRSTSEVSFPRAEHPLLNSILTCVKVIKPDGEGLPWWPAHLQSGSVSALDDAVAEAIQVKAALATSFEWQGASERWLLLVAEGNGLQDLVGQARQFTVRATPHMPFTTIIMWDRFSEDIWTLFPVHRVICDGAARLRNIAGLPASLQPLVSSSRYETRPTSSWRAASNSRLTLLSDRNWPRG